MANKNNYTVSVTQIRRHNYPDACKIIEDKGNNLSNLLLGALELVIKQNGLQGKDYKYVEWAVEGLNLGVERGDSDG